jgi:hypothetical protein
LQFFAVAAVVVVVVAVVVDVVGPFYKHQQSQLHLA